MKEILKKLIENNTTNFTNTILKKENSHILKWIIENTPEKLKNGNYKLSTIIFWILNDMDDFPKCQKCGKYLGINRNIRFFQGYKKYCRNCATHSDESNEKRKQTNLTKYGVENPFSNSEIKEKIKIKNLEKYGINCPAKSSEILNKIKKENLEKYGVENYQSTEEFKNKIKETCQKKYGTNNFFETEQFKIKSKTTLLNKYGVDHNMKSKKVQQIKKENFISKYGENYTQIIWGNRGNVGQSKRSYEYILKNPNIEPLFTVDEYIEGKLKDIKSKFKFRCKHCGTIFQSIWDNGRTNLCPICKRNNCTSNFEKEIVHFIEQISKVKLKTNDRTLISPLEIDCISENNKMCFEMDGLYWHCDDVNPNHNYHLNKTNLCDEKGYQLIHIFENEWIYKQDIVKSRLKNLFGIYDKTIYARNCEIRELSQKQIREFLENNHIQGYCSSKINLGLFYNDELVSLMTFGKPRFNKKYEYELLRFCNKLNHHIVGGASKLLKYFERNYKPKSLISYADRRWSKGDLYHKLGFEIIGNTKPNYWYIDFKTQNIHSRIKYQKHKLKNILENFDENLSETENMKNNGYGKIYDCGNLIFTKNFDII